MMAPPFGAGVTLLAAGVTPVRPGVFLSEQLLPHMMATIEDAASAMALPYSTIERLIVGDEVVTPWLAERLSRYTKLSVGFWLNMQGAYDLARRPMGRTD
jgi:antitoxin HigA-1